VFGPQKYIFGSQIGQNLSITSFSSNFQPCNYDLKVQKRLAKKKIYDRKERIHQKGLDFFTKKIFFTNITNINDLSKIVNKSYWNLMESILEELFNPIQKQPIQQFWFQLNEFIPLFSFDHCQNVSEKVKEMILEKRESLYEII
jgi:hypothetical protein